MQNIESLATEVVALTMRFRAAQKIAWAARTGSFEISRGVKGPDQRKLPPALRAGGDSEKVPTAGANQTSGGASRRLAWGLKSNEASRNYREGNRRGNYERQDEMEIAEWGMGRKINQRV